MLQNWTSRVVPPRIGSSIVPIGVRRTDLGAVIRVRTDHTDGNVVLSLCIFRYVKANA